VISPKYLWSRFKRRIKIAFILYLMAAGLMMVFQRDLLYVPFDGPLEPIKLGLVTYQRGGFAADDGTTIPYWETVRTSGPTLLFLHGNAGGLHAFKPWLEELAKSKYHVVAMEYRGFPGIGGIPSQNRIVRDAVNLYDTLPQPVIIWGYSLGTGVAMQLAARRPAKAIVLEAPFLSTAARGQEMFPIFPAKLMMQDQYRSDIAITKTSAPILILHGGDDILVPDHHGRELAALAPKQTTFRFYPEATHFNLPENGAYTDAFAWLSALK
jgi:uncharacterized protein